MTLRRSRTVYRSPIVTTVDTPRPTAFVPGDPRAIAAGKKSAEIRAQRREAQAAAQAIEQAENEAALQAFLALDLDTGPLDRPARAAIALVIKRVVLGTIPVRNGAEAAALIDKLHAVARLEAGAPTSINVSLQVGAGDAHELLEQRRSQLEPVDVVGRDMTPQVTAPAPPSE